MSLEIKLGLLVAAIATDIKTLLTNSGDLASLSTTDKTNLVAAINELKTNNGDLSTLTTTDKTNLVAALNELKTAVDSAGGSIIVDTSASTTTTYSSDKISTLISTAVASIVDSSPAALDTLNEFAIALGNDANFATTITTALGNRVRVDAAQTFSEAETLQARENIAAAGSVEFAALVTAVGDTEVDLVAAYTAAKI